jgi:integrase
MTKRTYTGESISYAPSRGAWELWYTDDKGKRRPIRLTDKDRKLGQIEAARQLRAKLDERRRNTEDSDLDPTTFAWLAEEWLREDNGGAAVRTLASYTNVVRNYLVPALGPTPTDQLDTLAVQRYLTKLAAMPGRRRHDTPEGETPLMSAGTVKKHRDVIGSICAAGVEWKRMPVNPVDAIRQRSRKRKLKLGVGPSEARWYSADEHAIAVEHITTTEVDEAVAMVAVMMFAGLRASELRALRWRNIVWPRGPHGSIHIVEAVKSDTGPVIIGAPKTEAGVRFIPMAAELAAILRRWAEASMASGRGEFVFGGDKVIGVNAPGAAARAFARATALPYLNPHGFRHTFASIALSNGIGYEPLRELMGHADVGELIKTYGHVVVDTSKLDMDKFTARVAS